jgi:catechol 2,3-dioxygenase-like lactoylglutathione lyase family enzyme
MFSLHHTHVFATDIDATIAFWRDCFEARVVLDAKFAGARNVFLRVGEGRLHLYDQPPRHSGQGTVHHLGIETDELEALVARLKSAGISVTEIKAQPEGSYAMAQAPDGLLLELFQPNPGKVGDLERSGYFATLSGPEAPGD